MTEYEPVYSTFFQLGTATVMDNRTHPAVSHQIIKPCHVTIIYKAFLNNIIRMQLADDPNMHFNLQANLAPMPPNHKSVL